MKWLIPANFAQNLHAESSSNGCAGSASDKKSTLRAHQMAPPGQLLHKSSCGSRLRSVPASVTNSVKGHGDGRASRTLFVDEVDRFVLRLRVGPEDLYSRLQSAILLMLRSCAEMAHRSVLWSRSRPVQARPGGDAPRLCL